MAPQPVVTGLSPKEGPPGTRVTIRGEFLGTRASDLIALTICDCDCLLSAEWKSQNKIIARTGPAKGKGDVKVTTISGGVGTSTVQFRAYHETIGPMKESAMWVEEMQSLVWGRRTAAPTAYGFAQEDPLGLSTEGNDNKFPEDLRDLFPERSGDLSQEMFSPAWFLLENHHATSFDDLKAGFSYLKRKVESQKEGQLYFLKSNAGSVIDQLDKLMTVKDKFQEDTIKFGNNPLSNLTEAIESSIKESNVLFMEVLLRREKADATRAALFALSRHKFLFCLPNSVEQNAKLQEYEIVANDYSRARNLFGKTELFIFKQVLQEVDTRISKVRQELYEKIIKMPQNVDQQKKLIKALINLEVQQIGLPVSNKIKFVDPAWDAIEIRSKYLEESFKTSFEFYSSKDTVTDKSKLKDPSHVPNRVAFIEDISEIAASQLPDLWHLGQSYFTGELKSSADLKPNDFKRIILNGIEKFCSYVQPVILVNQDQKSHRSVTSVSWSSSSIAINQFLQWLPECLRLIRILYATLIRLDLPNEALNIIKKLIDDMRLCCLTSIFKRSIERVKTLDKMEKWIMGVENFPGATTLSSYLEEIIIETLEECENIAWNPEIREDFLLEPYSDGEREVNLRLKEMLSSFCDVLEKLAFPVDCDQTPRMSQLIGSPHSQANGAENKFGTVITGWQQMLCSMANCAYCNQVLFPRIGTIFVKFGYPSPKLALESSRTTIHQLYTNILETYVEQKCDYLVGTIEPSMYIEPFQWNTFDNIGKLRPYAHECCDNLVTLYSEILTISPFLLRQIMEPIVQTVAEELARLMSCVQKFTTNAAIQANVDIRLMQDALKLYSTDTAKVFFNEALDAITPLSNEDSKRVESILKEVRAAMQLQLICFSVSEF